MTDRIDKMGKKCLRIAMVAVRTAVLLLLTVAFTELSKSVLIYTKYTLFENDYFPDIIVYVWNAVFFFFIFNSLVLVFNKHSNHEKESFLMKMRNKNFSSYAKLFLTYIKFVFSSLDFYAEIGCISVLSLLMSHNFLYGFVGDLFFKESFLSAEKVRIYTLLITLPIMFIISLLDHILVYARWYKESLGRNNKEEKTGSIWQTLKGTLFIGAIYFVASIVIPWFFPLLFSLWNVGGIKSYLWILFVIIAFFAVRITFSFVRALLKRASFIKKLKKYCKDNSVYISEIKKPLKSVFVSHDGADFTIEKNGKKYECKLIAGVFYNTPIIFSDKGGGIKRYHVRFLRVEWTRFSTRFDFAFESDGKKLLIIAPSPQHFFVSVKNCPMGLGDVGEKVGEYTIYNSSGFLNGLDRDIL